MLQNDFCFFIYVYIYIYEYIYFFIQVKNARTEPIFMYLISLIFAAFTGIAPPSVKSDITAERCP